jgi:hypothetical protein
MQIGTLVFGKLIGHRFDMSTKTWYILAAVKLDVAIFMEVRGSTKAGRCDWSSITSPIGWIEGLAKLGCFPVLM